MLSVQTAKTGTQLPAVNLPPPPPPQVDPKSHKSQCFPISPEPCYYLLSKSGIQLKVNSALTGGLFSPDHTPFNSISVCYPSPLSPLSSLPPDEPTTHLARAAPLPQSNLNPHRTATATAPSPTCPLRPTTPVHRNPNPTLQVTCSSCSTRLSSCLRLQTHNHTLSFIHPIPYFAIYTNISCLLQKSLCLLSPRPACRRIQLPFALRCCKSQNTLTCGTTYGEAHHRIPLVTQTSHIRARGR
jgi:hypothetical protein